MARACPRAATTQRRDPQARSRRRFARRQWARRWLTWRYVAAAAALLLVVGGGVYLVYFSPVLEVRAVKVTGTSTLTEQQVLAAAAVPTGGPLATADLAGVERRVSALATVRSADVTRQWPHDVHITIVERQPVAVIQIGSQLRALDASGVVFNTYRRAPAGLPRVEASTVTDSNGLSEVAHVVAALPEDIRSLTDHVQLVSADDIELDLKDGRTVRWGSASASAEKAEVLHALLRQHAQTYDVSVPDAPVTSG